MDIWGECWLQASHSLSWNVGPLTVPGGLQTFCSLSWSAINSPRHQTETWRRRWSCLNLSSSRRQVKEGVKLAVSGARWRQWRRGWHNSLQRVSRIFRVRVTAELSFPQFGLSQYLSFINWFMCICQWNIAIVNVTSQYMLVCPGSGYYILVLIC